MNATNAEMKYAKRMAKIAEREAKKLGLKPARYMGAWAGNAYLLEVQFTGLHAETVCEGQA